MGQIHYSQIKLNKLFIDHIANEDEPTDRNWMRMIQWLGVVVACE